MKTDAQRPKVVFLINSLTGGGAERVMATLLAASTCWEHRYDIHLILLDTEKDAYPLPVGLTVHRLDSGFSLFRAFRQVIPLLRSLKPVACVSFLTRANIVTIVAARFCGAKAIISERVAPSSHHGKDIAGYVARLATRLFYPLADRVICPSQGVARDLVERFSVRREQVAVIANPLGVEGIRSKAKEQSLLRFSSPYIVTVGRLVENKNISLLLEAMSRISWTQLHLVVLGEGPLRERLAKEAEALGLEDRVHFCGFVENPFPIIKRADLYVSSSNAEGFPNALLEAMALQVPVVASNCNSGPSEIIDDRETLDIDGIYEGRYGILVPVGDAAALAGAIERMMEETVRMHYREAAAMRADHFAGQAVPQRYWNVIENEIASLGEPQQDSPRQDWRRGHETS